MTAKGGTKSLRENSSADESRKYPMPEVINVPTKGAKVACTSRALVVIEFLLSEKFASVNVERLPVSVASRFCGACGSGVRVQLLPRAIGEVIVSSGNEYFCR